MPIIELFRTSKLLIKHRNWDMKKILPQYGEKIEREERRYTGDQAVMLQKNSVLIRTQLCWALFQTRYMEETHFKWPVLSLVHNNRIPFLGHPKPNWITLLPQQQKHNCRRSVHALKAIQLRSWIEFRIEFSNYNIYTRSNFLALFIHTWRKGCCPPMGEDKSWFYHRNLKNHQIYSI